MGEANSGPGFEMRGAGIGISASRTAIPEPEIPAPLPDFGMSGPRIPKRETREAGESAEGERA